MDMEVNIAASTMEDYSAILEAHGLSYVTDGYYLKVGNNNRVQGWMLDISGVASQFTHMLHHVLPILISEGVSFKIPRRKYIAGCLSNGELGLAQLGKLICVYPNDDIQAQLLANMLIALTNEFRGPDVLTDLYLGGTVYCRYGSFNPILRLGRNGNVETYIQGNNNELILDDCPVPFRLLDNVVCPFESVVKLENISDLFINKIYRIFSVLKSDSKGRVIKSLRFHRFGIGWCIIKEGRHDICFDSLSRDVTDRIRWQYSLHRELEGEVPLPKVYDMFFENRNAFIVMEYVKGVPLRDVVDEVYAGESWRNLTSSKRHQLVDYLLQIVDIILKLHSKGYIHRDITYTNFLLTRKRGFVLIDMELSYFFKDGNEQIPFGLGTAGFMSPEQEAGRAPTVKEDVYGFGALMIYFVTHLLPQKFSRSNSKELFNNLLFFVADVDLVSLIAKCLNANPELRPDLIDVKHRLQEYSIKPVQLDIQDQFETPLKKVFKHDESGIAEVDILNREPLLQSGSLWHSNVDLDGMIDSMQVGATYYPGFFRGISGVLYFLGVAEMAGVNVDSADIQRKNSYAYLEKNYLNNFSITLPGLYYGLAGCVLALSAGLSTNVLDFNLERKNLIRRCLEMPNSNLNLADGVAGQGITLLRSLPYVGEDEASRLMGKYLDIVLGTQQRDGSWVQDSSCKKVGFSHGLAGIVCFLLEYLRFANDPHVVKSLENALRWLGRQSISNDHKLMWYMDSSRKQISPWLGDGFTGVALTYVKAYQVLGDLSYKMFAERALNSHPKCLVDGNLTMSHGVVGIGEVYLEAFRVFKNDEWFFRSEWIANLLHSLRKNDGGQSSFWITEDDKLPTADFMVGNSGIMHFLLRSKYLDKISFPLLM